MNKHAKGVLIAAAVAGLFLSGQAIAAEGDSGSDTKVKCVGGNECKGKSACGTKEHSCHGQNACKGKGWVTTTEADCKAKGGTVEK